MNLLKLGYFFKYLAEILEDFLDYHGEYAQFTSTEEDCVSHVIFEIQVISQELIDNWREHDN